MQSRDRSGRLSCLLVGAGELDKEGNLPFFLKAKRLDISSGTHRVVFNKTESERLGIRQGDLVNLVAADKNQFVASAHYSDVEIQPGEIGLFKEIWRSFRIKDGAIVEVSLLSRPHSIEAIKRKLLGERLSYEEYHSIIKDLIGGRLTDVEATYFVASGFARDFSDDELYYLAKAMAETGEKINLPGPVTDIHSVGGLPGNRTTMLAAPIVAALGFVIPKTSSRAITSPSGVADTMAFLANNALAIPKIKEVVKKTKGCLVWGGAINLAPADDKIIQLSYSLALEPYTKMLVSIMAKKVAMGIDYLILEMPVGPTTKIHNFRTAGWLSRRLIRLGKRFKIKVRVVKLNAYEPTGHGVGPALEARDVFRVLRRQPNRSHTLERNALKLVAELLELMKVYPYKIGFRKAKEVLEAKKALKKMEDIILAQGPKINPPIDPEKLTKGALTFEVKAQKGGRIASVNNQALTELARILGAPVDKIAGLDLHHRVNDFIKKGEPLFTIYVAAADRLDLAKKALERIKIFYY